MDVEIKREIKKMRKDQKYDEIFTQFGQNAYNKYTPKKYKMFDKEKLIYEGKYEDIYNKYGIDEYEDILLQSMYSEIKQEKGIVRASLWKMGQNLQKISKNIAIYGSYIFLAITSITSINIENIVRENGKTYQTQIDSYDKQISEYANRIKNMNLTDIQIFMKVMNDMWKNIKGYGTPKKNIIGYLELDLDTREGQGVCRNMASDIAKKLNKINEEYQARVIYAKMGREGIYHLADIERNILEDGETVKDNTIKSGVNTSINNENVMTKENLIDKIVPNHAVVLAKVQEDNLIVILDPTNPGIGIYYEGKIIMFNSEETNGLKLEAKEYITALVSGRGMKGFITTIQDYIESYERPKISLEEAKEKFGLEAQNEALKQVNMKEKHDKGFLESIKIENLNTNTVKNNNQNVVMSRKIEALEKIEER